MRDKMACGRKQAKVQLHKTQILRSNELTISLYITGTLHV